MSKSGDAILLKTISSVYYWHRQKNEPVYQTLRRPPVRQVLYQPKGQEEAIAFTRDEKGFLILSEGKGTPIYYYPLKK